LIVQSALGSIQVNPKNPESCRLHQQVTLILKPSGLIIQAEDNSEPQATVLDCVFSGEVFRLILEVNKTKLKVVSREAYIPGNKTGFKLYPDAVICLPKEELNS